MPENPDAEVDPRFDPVFQRGYDPEKHGGRRPRSAPRHGTEPVPIASIRGAPPAAPDAARPTAAAAVPGAKAATEPDTDVRLTARNPYRLALLIASIVAIAGAALAIWNRVGEDVYYGGFSGTNQGLLFRSQLIAALPVPALTGGILGLILWLAIGAMAHREKTDD
jgi:hypothetical protein